MTLPKELMEKRAAALKAVEDAKTMEELDAAELELRKVEIEIKRALEAMGDPDDGEGNREPTPAGARKFNPIATFDTRKRGDEKTDDEDVYASLEYRKAFKDYVLRATPLPDKFREKRKNEVTVVGDIGAVIPTTILNMVVEDKTVEGKILPRITQTSYAGGVEIPVSEFNPTATWVNSDTRVADEQKAVIKANIKFAYHLLECRVAVDLVADTVALPIFEATISRQIKSAMVRALETAIISGTGSGQPLGITKYSNLPKEQTIEMDEKDIGTVKKWAEVEAALPEAYEEGAVYLMAKPTWEKYLNGMTDTNGQKIGLGKINEAGVKVLNGREVIVTDKLPTFDKAEGEDIFAVLVDLKQYALNTNMAMYYKTYFDENANKKVHKAIMIADGKMAIGDNEGTLIGAGCLVYIKKKASEAV